jgi:hypothetical protein
MGGKEESTICQRCGILRKKKEFSRNLRIICYPCREEEKKLRPAKSIEPPGKQKPKPVWKDSHERKLYLTYGITWREYHRILELQGGVCAGCKFPPKPDKKLCVDHCHSTGKIRGLLCHECNTALGWVKDRKETLASLSRYVENPTVGISIPEHGLTRIHRKREMKLKLKLNKKRASYRKPGK